MMTTKNETVETIEEEERKPNIISKIIAVIMALALFGLAINVMAWIGGIALMAIFSVMAS